MKGNLHIDGADEGSRDGRVLSDGEEDTDGLFDGKPNGKFDGKVDTEGLFDGEIDTEGLSDGKSDGNIDGT